MFFNKSVSVQTIISVYLKDADYQQKVLHARSRYK